MTEDQASDPSRPTPQQLDVLLRAVLDLPVQDRERWIEASSAGDGKLREQLRELLLLARTGMVPAVRVEPPPSGGGSSPEFSTGSSRPQPASGDRLGRY